MKRHPLRIAVVSKNSPGDIFGKWFRFGMAFEQAHRVSLDSENSFSSIRGLLSSLVRGVLSPLLTIFSPLAAKLLVRASSNVI